MRNKSISFFFLLAVAAISSAHSRELEDVSSQPHLLERKTVPNPKGEIVYKTNFFIGDLNEHSTHAIRNSNSFTRDTWGDNYYADYDQQDAVKLQIASLPEDMPVNLIGHGLGGAAAANIAVDMASKRIDTLITVALRGNYPDSAIIKNSVNKWVNVGALP